MMREGGVGAIGIPEPFRGPIFANYVAESGTQVCPGPDRPVFTLNNVMRPVATWGCAHRVEGQELSAISDS